MQVAIKDKQRYDFIRSIATVSGRELESLTASEIRQIWDFDLQVRDIVTITSGLYRGERGKVTKLKVNLQMKPVARIKKLDSGHRRIFREVEVEHVEKGW